MMRRRIHLVNARLAAKREWTALGHIQLAFPLTPALSPRERESRSPSLDKPGCADSPNALATIPPLPKGEGRGEGERGARAQLDSAPTHRGILSRVPASADRGRIAFSLVEVLVAVSLLAFIIVGLTMMFNEVKRTMRRGVNQVDVLEGARATLSLIAQAVQELTPSQIPDTNYVSFYVGPDPKLNPFPAFEQPLPGGGARVNVRQDIFLLTRVDDEWRAVSFAFDPNEASAGVGALFMRIDSAPWMDLRRVSYWTNTLFQPASAASGFRRLVDGVVHFRVTPYDSNGLPILYGHPMLAPDTNGVAWAFLLHKAFTTDQVYSYWFHNNFLPAAVDVELGLLESQTLAQFHNITNAGPASAFSFLTNHLGRIHLFRQRIPVRTQDRLVP